METRICVRASSGAELVVGTSGIVTVRSMRLLRQPAATSPSPCVGRHCCVHASPVNPTDAELLVLWALCQCKDARSTSLHWAPRHQPHVVSNEQPAQFNFERVRLAHANLVIIPVSSESLMLINVINFPCDRWPLCALSPDRGLLAHQFLGSNRVGAIFDSRCLIQIRDSR